MRPLLSTVCACALLAELPPELAAFVNEEG